MDLSFKGLISSKKNIFILLITAIVLIGLFAALKLEAQKPETDLSAIENRLITIQGNTLVPVTSLAEPAPKTVRKIRVVLTGYSSSPWETDDTPYLTAAGTRVREGVIANNYFPFGTKVRMPELYGDKVFVVEDRMSWKKGNYHFDIWFADRAAALDFGTKQTTIEVLES